MQTRNVWAALAATATLFAATGVCAGAEPSPEQVDKARAAVAGLAEGLKARLGEALKAGGPVAAVQVCNTVAPGLAADAAKTTGLSVGRTALKVRNPENAPDEFEKRVLMEFAAKIAAGSDPAKLEHAEIVDDGGSRMVRYMKAIPTAAEPCLVCHGETLAPDLKAEIDKLYPNDQATGFKAGDLRGAFTVIEILNDD